MDRTASGALARWSCAAPITVRLAGPAPAGAATTLADTVSALRSASHLPLTVGRPLPHIIANVRDVPAGTITFSYLTSTEISAAHLDLTGDVLGEGGPVSDQSGRIISAWVVIRSDIAGPTTLMGQRVAWHEGGHSLNLGHTGENSSHREIMERATDGSGPLAWGPGDAYALSAVGCT